MKARRNTGTMSHNACDAAGRARSCPMKARKMHKHDDAQCMRCRCTSAFLPNEGEEETRARCRTMHVMQMVERVPAQWRRGICTSTMTHNACGADARAPRAARSTPGWRWRWRRLRSWRWRAPRSGDRLGRRRQARVPRRIRTPWPSNPARGSDGITRSPAVKSSSVRVPWRLSPKWGCEVVVGWQLCLLLLAEVVVGWQLFFAVCGWQMCLLAG
jgi:hypothetical protein